jgi:CHAT domain-containing protein
MKKKARFVLKSTIMAFMGNRDMHFKKIVLRVTRDEKHDGDDDQSHIKLKMWEDDNETLSQYTLKSFSQSQVDHDCQKIITFLNENSRKSGNGASLKKLKGMGSKLADMLLEPVHKEILCSTQIKYLDLKLDDHLVQIPWELLYIGDFFLCERFCIGRRVETRQSLVKYQKRPLTYPLNMWIIAPPEKDLINTEEGLTVFKNINSTIGDKPFFDADLDVDVTADQIKEKIRMYDILHFAGHGIFNSKNPGLSGWKLAGENLIASDIHQMAGGKALPFIVFSNACQSARTDEWNNDSTKNNSSFGLANAFMFSGVRHYIGTFGDIPDDMSRQIAMEFYKNLASGKTIGQSLRDARIKLMKESKNLCWANYIMYGDPTVVYVSEESQTAPTETGQTTSEETQNDIPEAAEIPPHESFPKQLHTRTNGNDSETSISERLITDKPDEKPPSEMLPTDNPDQKIGAAKGFILFLGAIVLISAILFVNNKFGGKSPVDDWTSKPMTLTVVFKVSGQQIEKKLENMISQTIQIRLKEYGRFILLERMDIDIILEELKLWESSFTQKGETPDLLKADLFLLIDVKPGEIVKNIPTQNYADLSLRLIETRSSESKPFHYYERIQGDLFDQRKRIADIAVETLDKYYPLRGKITRNNNVLILNIGEKVGIKIGQKFQVVGNDIVLRVQGIEKDLSVVVIEGDEQVKAGWKVVGIR